MYVIFDMRAFYSLTHLVPWAYFHYILAWTWFHSIVKIYIVYQRKAIIIDLSEWVV